MAKAETEEPNSPLRGMRELVAKRDHQAEYDQLNQSVGQLILGLTGEDVFEFRDPSRNDLFPQEWKPRLEINDEEHTVRITVEKAMQDGRRQRVEASYSNETGLKIVGERTELQERIDGYHSGSSAEQVSAAFDNAVMNPLIIKNTPAFLRKSN